MGLSNCDKCKYFDRSPHHSGDIVCGLNPAYALMWKQLASVDEYTLGCMPIDSCGEFELEPTLKNKEICLSLSFNDWQKLTRECPDLSSSIIEALDRTLFDVNLSLTIGEWQKIADATTVPNVRVRLHSEGIEARRDAWIQVDSSCLDAVAYNETESILKIRFNSGSTYQYDHVPQNIYFDLLDAHSQGMYFNLHIKDCYSYRQI